MQRETMLFKTDESFVIENIGFRFEPKHKSNMKNIREEEWTCDPGGTMKHAIKILLKGLREMESQTNTKCETLTHIPSPTA